MSGYLRIRNWERFQHYKNRRPPWIKFYVEILDDDAVISLPLATQLLLDRLLLVAALTDNRISVDTGLIARRTHIPRRQVTVGLAQLLAIGFLEASNPLAERKHFASPETETELETDTPLPPKEELIKTVTDVKAKLFAVKAAS